MRSSKNICRSNAGTSESIICNFSMQYLYVAENGCKWRALPKEYGSWHTIYVRMNRWSKNGVLDKIFTALQEEGIIDIKVEVLCLDSTTVKVHPDACGALKKEANKQSDVQEADLQRKSIQSSPPINSQ